MEWALPVGERSLRHPGQPTQLVSLQFKVRSLRGVEKNVHLAEGAECRTRPDPYLPALKQRRVLTRELPSQLGLELAVLRVQDSIPTGWLLPSWYFLTLNRRV